MGCLDESELPVLAQGLSIALGEVAARLEVASDLDEFLAAMADNEKLWKSLGRERSRLGVKVPERFLDYSLEASRRGRQGLSDHEVETLIHINRFVAAALVEDTAD
ncbi:MAG: hypothetical protein ACM31L_02560 [Actinomycetota bacterium]